VTARPGSGQANPVRSYLRVLVLWVVVLTLLYAFQQYFS
jgi:hypothetical protein